MNQDTADTAKAEVPQGDAAPATGAAGTDPEDVLEALRDVVDPELGINVVDLGLVYGLAIGEDGVTTIDMTLTSAACPLTDVIEDQAGQWAGGAGRPRARLPDQLGLDAALGPGQDHRRRPRAAQGPRLQRLIGPRHPGWLRSPRRA